MKLGTVQHPKFIKLARRLKLKPYEAAGVLEMLWAMAAQYTDDGDLSRFDNDDIACYIGWDGDSAELVTALVDLRWIDRIEGRLVIHDWDDHKPYFVTERLRKREQRAGTTKKPADHPATVPALSQDETKTVPVLSQDSPGTVANNPSASDLAQSSPVESSQAQRSAAKKFTHTHTPSEEEKPPSMLGVVVPSEISADWARWCKFRLAIDGKWPDPISSEAIVMDLSRRGFDKAKRDIDFSIRKNAKSILDSDNDFEQQRAQRPKRESKKPAWSTK